MPGGENGVSGGQRWWSGQAINLINGCIHFCGSGSAFTYRRCFLCCRLRQNSFIFSGSGRVRRLFEGGSIKVPKKFVIKKDGAPPNFNVLTIMTSLNKFPPFIQQDGFKVEISPVL